MVIFSLQVSNTLTSNFESHLNNQILINKLISISDYVVRYGAAEKTNDYFIPNKILKSELQSLDIKNLQHNLELNSLEIGFEKTGHTCIYRLVLYENTIKKLYFCGD